MILSRRIAIKYITIGTAGYALLSSCTGNSNQPMLEAAKKLGLNAGEENTLAALCRLILPLKSPGSDMENPELHAFVLKMVTDCQSPEKQQQYKLGLQQFRSLVKMKTNFPLEETKPTELIPIFEALEKSKDLKDYPAFFYQLTKSLTIQGYKGSKFFLTQVIPYKLVPGKYIGCS